MFDVGLITHPYTSHNQSNWAITHKESHKKLCKVIKVIVMHYSNASRGK